MISLEVLEALKAGKKVQYLSESEGGWVNLHNVVNSLYITQLTNQEWRVVPPKYRFKTAAEIIATSGFVNIEAEEKYGLSTLVINIGGYYLKTGTGALGRETEITNMSPMHVMLFANEMP